MPDISRAELKYFVERQREEIKTLNEVGRLLSTTADPRSLVRLVSSYLHRAFPVALCSVLSLPQRRLYVVPFAPIPQVDVSGAVRLTRDTAARLLNRSVTEDESACLIDDDQPAGWMQSTISLRSNLFCSMSVSGQLTGVLGVFSGQANAFNTEDAHAIGIVAEQLAAALRNAVLLDQLRQADELKNQLLSIVSHELSTPLTAIKKGVNLVLEGALGETTDEQRDFLKTVLENADRLERLTQKVKTATELMTGQTKFTFDSFDLRTVLGQVEKTYRPLAVAKGVNLKLLDAPKPMFWPIDKNHIVVAISQLVENAIQATGSDGLITLKLSATPTEADIVVNDTGSGIAQELIPTLFEQFKSIGEIHNRKMGGLGLGLFIAHALIVGHGGTIEVDSKLEVGTCMTIHLPKERKVTA